jgi:hypothetical protein
MRAFYGSAITENLAKTPEGYLICRNVILARTATKIPQIYKASELGNSGSEQRIPVWRPESEVLSKSFLASLEGKPVCKNHPPGFLTPANVNTYMCGVVMNTREGPTIEGERTVEADLLIYDRALIDEILSGRLRELSVGYDTCYVEEPHGDGLMQTQLSANHVACVAAARAGPLARIMDSDSDRATSEVLEKYLQRHTPKPTVQSVMRRFEETLTRYAERGPEEARFCTGLVREMVDDTVRCAVMDAAASAESTAAEYAGAMKRFHRGRNYGRD